MPGKPHPTEVKQLAVRLKHEQGTPAPTVAALLGIDSSTVYRWLERFRAMDDSEKEAFVRDKRKTCDALWASLEEVSLIRAMLEQIAGSANEAKHAATAGGISRDKLAAIGQPQNIINSCAKADIPLLDTTEAKPSNDS